MNFSVQNNSLGEPAIDIALEPPCVTCQRDPKISVRDPA
jgi:hypothetical protein